MHKVTLVTIILCILSTQVLGSVAFEKEHSSHVDGHSLMHKLNQPHSHDIEDDNNVKVSYSDEAIEHINQDSDSCVIGVLDMSEVDLSERKPTYAIHTNVHNWPPPFLQHIKPPPR